MPRYYTLIGSRSTPEPVLRKLRTIASILDDHGYMGRSGGADGADSALEDAAHNIEIFLPWNGFNDRYVDGVRYFLPDPSLEAEAIRYAQAAHPKWEKCKPSHRKLHGRNPFQVLGADLQTPSEFVIFYAQPKRDGKEGAVMGGTNTAVSVALSKGIPVYNLFYPSTYIEVLGMLDEIISRNGE